MAFATWNPSDKGSACVLSNGNLTAVGPQTNGSVRTTIGSAAKFVVEFTSTGSPRLPIAGIGTAGASLANFPGSDAAGWSYWGLNAKKFTNGVQTAFGTAWSPTSQAVMMYVDPVAGTVGFIKAGVDMGVAFTFAAGQTLYPMTGGDTDSGSSNCTINCGASAFTNTVPAGYPAGLSNTITAVATGLLATNVGTPVAAWTQFSTPSGLFATNAGTPVAAYTQVGASSGFLSNTFGQPRSVALTSASGFLTQFFGTPALLPSAVGFLATRYGTGSTHTTVTTSASGFAAQNFGTPTWQGITRHNAAALAPTSRVGTPTTPTERYTQALGLRTGHVGDPVALRFVPPGLNQLADASGVHAFNAGTPSTSTTVSAAATGANAFHAGMPVARPATACAAVGVAAFNVGTPTTQAATHAHGWRAAQIGTPTCARVFQALGSAPRTRFGTPTYSRGALTHFAASAGRRTRFGQPKAFIGKVAYPAGFNSFNVGTPAAFDHHRASALAPNTRFGTPLVLRSTEC